MPIFIARLYRIVPLIVVLVAAAVIAIIIARRSRNGVRVTAIVLRIFWWLCAGGCALFLLASGYAVLDKSELGVDLFLSCVFVFAVGWVVDLVCAWRFRKNNPHYRLRPTRPRPKSKHR